MALRHQAALIDELMGTKRNSTNNQEMTWQGENVCKFFLAGFCPHELFVNTRMSLGDCPKYHNDKLLESYKKDALYLKVGYERKLKNFLDGFVRDVRKKIVANVDRLNNGSLNGSEYTTKQRIKNMESEVNNLVSLIEEKANLGQVTESVNLNSRLENIQRELKYDKIELEIQRQISREHVDDVCQLCGSFVNRSDPRNGVESHNTGRMHRSYVKINDVISQLDKLIRDSSSATRSDEEENGRRQRTREDCEEEPVYHLNQDQCSCSRYRSQRRPERRQPRENSYRRGCGREDHQGYRERSRSRACYRSQRHQNSHRHSESRDEQGYSDTRDRSRRNEAPLNRQESPQYTAPRPQPHHDKNRLKKDKHQFEFDEESE